MTPRKETRKKMRPIPREAFAAIVTRAIKRPPQSLLENRLERCINAISPRRRAAVLMHPRPQPSLSRPAEGPPYPDFAEGYIY
jgi:hypothetical protein